MSKLKSSFARAWHRFFMKYNFSLYEECLDPNVKAKLYEKANFHANKILRS